jgi:hypothetical protein
LAESGPNPLKRPLPDGIVTEVVNSELKSYDYWAARENGDFYCFESLMEDTDAHERMDFDSRIERLTEALLYCQRLYQALGVDENTIVTVHSRLGGLRDRAIRASNRGRGPRRPRVCTVDEMESEISSPIGEVSAHLASHVKALLAKTFMLFDYFELPDADYDNIVERFRSTHLR